MYKKYTSSWQKLFPYHTWNNLQPSSQHSIQTYQMTWNSRHVHHLMTFRVTRVSCDHQSFHGRRSFQLNNSFNSIFPGEYHNNYSHNPNMTWNSPGASHLQQVRYVVNNVNMLMIVMSDQDIIQVAISSVETFDGNKTKFEAWITSAENTAQISGQDMLWIAFSKMMGSPLTSAYRLRDGSSALILKELKSEISRQYFSIPLTVIQPRLFLIYDKAWMNYLKCIYSVQVSSYWKYATLQTCLRFQQRVWTITLCCIAWNPEHWEKVPWDTEVCDQWKTASEISMYLVWATKELNAMAELNSMPWKHQQCQVHKGWRTMI